MTNHLAPRSLVACILVLLCASLASADLASWQAAVEANRAALPNVLTAEDAAGATDGDTTVGYPFHTSQDASPWWQVDLEAEVHVSRVTIYAPHIPERLDNFHLKVSADGLDWRIVHDQGDTACETKMEIDVDAEGTRFVRVQVPRPEYMHMSEVHVFAGDDLETNIAFQKPADQSSTSQWSTRSVTLNRDTTEWTADRDSGRRAIAGVASHAGPTATELNARAASLHQGDKPLDDAAWVSVYDDVVGEQAKWSVVETQWPLVNLDALDRALDDLSARFPERYKDVDSVREQLAKARDGQETIQAGIDAGEMDAWHAAAEIVAIQRDVLLANPLLDFEKLVVLRRHLGGNARAATGGALGVGAANHTSNDSMGRMGWNNEISALSDLRGASTLETIYKPETAKIITDLDMNFDAGKIMFSSVGDTESNWRVFEVGADGNDLTQVTPDDGTDVGHFDSCYLPDGDIIFASTATYQGLPCVYGSSQMVSLYRLYRDSGRVRQLTFEQDSDWCPTVLADGRVMYLRWEYADLPHSSSRVLFRMNPDGTEQQEYYGSGSYFMPSYFDARPIPGDPSRVIGIATGHHGIARSGRLIIVDPGLGSSEADGVVQEIPGWGTKVEPVVKDRLVDGVWPQFCHPWPLSEEYHIVAMKPSATALWGVYLVDTFDNMTLIRQDEGVAYLDPMPLQARTAPPALSDRVESNTDEASVFLADIYDGPGLAGVPRGEVKSLRVISYYFSSRGVGGLLGSIGMDGPWDIKRVLGTVPVEEDGSAAFTIPANTPIAVQPLDDEGKALQLMRSWFVGMPGEVVSCTGCHESRNRAVAPKPTLATARELSEIEPWHAPAHGFSFPDDVQPVLDRNCIACHDGSAREDGATMIDLRGDEYITDWSSQISGNCGPQKGGNFTVSYANLHRFVRRPGIESDLHMLTPGEFHADTTELVQMLRDSRHHGVTLDRDGWDSLVTWIDLNTPFHGTWSEVAPYARDQVAKVNERRIELSNLYAGIDIDFEAKPYLRADATEPILPDARPEAATPPITPGWPFAADEATRRQGSDATTELDLGEGLAMKLSRIPAGKYVMGGLAPRVVDVERSFWMGTYEITNEQFARFDPDHDSRHESRHGYQFGRVGYPMTAPDAPVLRVNWNDAVAYCEWLSEETGKRFSLPTEEQWEHAARAGADTEFSFGALGTDYTTFANLGDLRLKEFAACTAQGNYTQAVVLANPGKYDDWVPKDTKHDDGNFLTSDVGSYAPNAWGLHDMHGNVWEWTLSERAEGRKVARGGSWYDRPERCAADSWLDYRPHHKVFNVGFRVVCEE